MIRPNAAAFGLRPSPRQARLLRFAAVALFAVACGSPPPPPRRAAPAAAPSKPIDEEAKPETPANIYVYSPIGKRDPFQNMTLTQGITHMEQKGRAKTALEKWPIEQLKLALTMTGTANPMAMVEDPEHRGWAVHLGDFIGQNGGKVTQIHRDEVVITETITDHSTGRVYPQTLKLSVPVDKAEEADLRALQEGETLGASKGSP
jgi:type IV pilus assembly protein PilP